MSTSPAEPVSITLEADSAHARSMRTRQIERGPRILVHGLTYFGNVLAKMLNGDGWIAEYHGEQTIGQCTGLARALASCDLVYQIGGRVSPGPFLRIAKLLGKKRIVIHWCGSDVLIAKSAFRAGKENPWILNECCHWAEAPWLADELRPFGLKAEVVPLTSFHLPSADIPPMPEQFSVLVYVTDFRKARFYGLTKIVKAAELLPEIEFKLVGPLPKKLPYLPSNVFPLGWVEDMRSIYPQICVLWRPVRHDGLSFMVVEALAHGRKVLYSYNYPGCIHVTDVAAAVEELKRFYELHGRGSLFPDPEISAKIRKSHNPEVVRHGILSRFERILASSTGI